MIEDLSSFLTVQDAGKRPSPPEERPDYGTPGTRIKLQGVRRKIAERMVHSKHTIPHYTYVDECDATDLVRVRENLRDVSQRAGVKVTYLAFFVKAVVAALKQVPIVNASLEDAAGEIVLHDHYNVGIAVATPAGLIVPVIHDVDRKDLIQIARDIERLSAQARGGKIRLEDLRGHVHHHVHWQHRRPVLRPGNQSPGGGDTGRRQDHQATRIRRCGKHPSGRSSLFVVHI